MMHVEHLLSTSARLCYERIHMAKYHHDLYTEAWIHEVYIGIARRTL